VTKPSAKPEASLQRAVRETLVTLGYNVMETGKTRSRVPCPRCQFSVFPGGWQGNTPGLPDLYVHRRGWPVPIGVALELKAPKGRPSDVQKQLAETGQTAIVRSIEEALRQVRDVERTLGNEANALRIEEVIKINGWQENV